MTHDNHIDDEMLARYLSGIATAEEDNAVVEAVGDNAELESEILYMADAIAAQRRAEQEQRKAAVVRRRVWSIAAMVAVVLVSGVVWIANRNDNKGVLVAENHMDPITVEIQPDPMAADIHDDDASVVQINDNRLVSSPTRRSTGTFDETGSKLKKVQKDFDNRIAKDYLEERAASSEYKRLSHVVFDRLENQSYSYNSNKVNPLEVFYPGSQNEKVSKNNDITFKFRNIGGTCMLVVKNAEGVEIIRVDVSDKDSYILLHDTFSNTGSLTWMLTHVGSEGDEIRRSGTIVLIE